MVAYHVSTQILRRTTVFNIDSNKICFFSTKSACFLKDHVTVKTEIMAAENLDLSSQERNRIKKYREIEKSYFELQYFTVVYCVFDQIIAALVKLMT